MIWVIRSGGVKIAAIINVKTIIIRELCHNVDRFIILNDNSIHNNIGVWKTSIKYINKLNTKKILSEYVNNKPIDSGKKCELTKNSIDTGINKK